MRDFLQILGARGSVPVSGQEYQDYGGATTSFLLCLSGQLLVVDAGNGILKTDQALKEQAELPLFLTHLHLDHLVGLPLWPYLFSKEHTVRIYAEQAPLHQLFAPPFWPVELDKLPARVEYRSLQPRQTEGPVLVETMPGCHPGGVAVLKFSAGGKKVVIATDCTLTEELKESLLSFAEGCDLLLIDGQYSDEQWEQVSGFGHSTFTAAARFAKACGAKTTRIIHHDPGAVDSALFQAERTVAEICPSCAFGKEGERIFL